MASRFKLVTPVSRFQIESNVPLLASKTGRTGGRDYVYPFADMRVGDSFEVPLSQFAGRSTSKPKLETVQSTLGNCARGYAKRHNRKAKFVTRQIDGVAVRVWRVA